MNRSPLMGITMLAITALLGCLPLQPATVPPTVVATPEAVATVQWQKVEVDSGALTFDVGYDGAVWEYVEDNGSGRMSQLIHRELTGCALWLRAGPVGTSTVTNTRLAGYEWTIGQVQPNILLYSTQPGESALLFGLLLPEPYAVDSRSPCQEAAENVIETLQVAS